jgi:hypothetical protein
MDTQLTDLPMFRQNSEKIRGRSVNLVRIFFLGGGWGASPPNDFDRFLAAAGEKFSGILGKALDLDSGPPIILTY